MHNWLRRHMVEALLTVGWAASGALIYWWIDAMGLLAGIATGTLAALMFRGKTAAQVRMAYAHGYHAGYHAGDDIECFGPDCELLTMTQQRLDEIDALATVYAGSGPFPVVRQ